MTQRAARWFVSGETVRTCAIRLALAAAVRHDFKNYDELLLRGHDRYAARALIRDRSDELLDAWRAGRQAGRWEFVDS